VRDKPGKHGRKGTVESHREAPSWIRVLLLLSCDFGRVNLLDARDLGIVQTEGCGTRNRGEALLSVEMKGVVG